MCSANRRDKWGRRVAECSFHPGHENDHRDVHAGGPGSSSAAAWHRLSRPRTRASGPAPRSPARRSRARRRTRAAGLPVRTMSWTFRAPPRPSQASAARSSAEPRPLALLGRVDAEVVHPAAVPVDAGHHGADHPPGAPGHQDRRRRPRAGLGEVGVRVVPRAGSARRRATGRRPPSPRRRAPRRSRRRRPPGRPRRSRRSRRRRRPRGAAGRAGPAISTACRARRRPPPAGTP